MIYVFHSLIDAVAISLDYAEYKAAGKGLSSFARVDEDGRIVISLDLKQKLPDLPKDYAKSVEEFALDEQTWRDVPRMNIVIMIVGSRGAFVLCIFGRAMDSFNSDSMVPGDVQPYVALGKMLIKDGHRVRIATHETFRSFVTDAGLEFFCIGGNPQDLMSYMVKSAKIFIRRHSSFADGSFKILVSCLEWIA